MKKNTSTIIAALIGAFAVIIAGVIGLQGKDKGRQASSKTNIGISANSPVYHAGRDIVIQQSTPPTKDNIEKKNYRLAKVQSGVLPDNETDRETVEPDRKKQRVKPLSGKKEKPVDDRGRQPQPLDMGLRPQIDEKGKRLQEFKSLINDSVYVQRGKSNVALVIEAKNTEGGVSPESLLHNRFKAENANIIDNLFKKAPFKSKGFFEEIYDGNTELLRQTYVLSKLDKLILGKLNYSCQRGVAIDKDLVSCDIRFSYKVFDKNGDAVRSDSINAVGPGFSEDAALERGLEILTEKYSDRILKN